MASRSGDPAPHYTGTVRFLGLEVRSTSDRRRRWAKPAKTGFDPRRELVTLWVKPVKIGARIVGHWRYVTFQMAEVAESRDLSAKFCG